MEYVEGETLRELVRRSGPLDVSLATRYLRALAGALAVAHAAGVVHRDVKPDNVLVPASGEIKLTDLGLAMFNPLNDSERIEKGHSRDSDLRLTRVGTVLGTPSYMAPEQWQDASNVTSACDVWALGAVLHFMLAGSDAFTGTLDTIMRAVCTQEFPELGVARRNVPTNLVKCLKKCTSRVPSERYQSAIDLLAVLPKSKRPSFRTWWSRLRRDTSIAASTQIVGRADGPFPELRDVPRQVGKGEEMTDFDLGTNGRSSRILVGQFVSLEDGTIHDRTTGLSWRPLGWANHLSTQAQVRLLNVDVRDKPQWRLPTVPELLSLTASEQIDGSFLQPSFPLKVDIAWTSDTVLHNPLEAWVVVFRHGSVWPIGTMHRYEGLAVRSEPLRS